MTAFTRLVHGLAGSPEPIASTAALLREHPAVCAICAVEEHRTAPFDRALGKNFTDRSLVRASSDRVCRACLWCCSGKPPTTLRMWTVIAAPDAPPSHVAAWFQNTPGLSLTSQADAGPVARILAEPPRGPWGITVTLSRQKHVVPYGTVNISRDRWSVRMETATITSTPAEWREVHGHAVALRSLGCSAADVVAGIPSVTLRTRDALAAWRTHAEPLIPYRGSPLLDLALWTITKGTLNATT